MRNVLDGFKTFIMRGNVLDLAVAVVIGAAFKSVVDALVGFIITPFIGMVVGKASLARVWDISFNNATISVGGFLDAVLQFVMVAAAVYFFIVLPINHLNERRRKGLEPAPEPLPELPSEKILILQEIRDLLAAGRGPSAPGTSGTGTGHPFA